MPRVQGRRARVRGVVIRDDPGDGSWFTVEAPGVPVYRFHRDYVEILEYEEGRRAVLKTRAGYIVLVTNSFTVWTPAGRRARGADRG